MLVQGDAGIGRTALLRRFCAQEAAAEISAGGESAVGWHCDVTDRADVDQAVTGVVERFGGVDVLVNNAGLLSGRRSFLDVDKAEMLRYFDSIGINLDSRLRVLTRREFAGMISVAVESPDGGPTTVDLGSPAAQAIWMVAG